MECRGNEAVEEVRAGVGTLRDVVEVDGESKSCERMEDDDGMCAGGEGRWSSGGAADW
jgi:hypothetical protein